MNKLLLIASLFFSTFSTACLTDETDTIDPDPAADPVVRDDDEGGPDQDTDDNGCHIRKDTGELECPSEE